MDDTDTDTGANWDDQGPLLDFSDLAILGFCSLLMFG